MSASHILAFEQQLGAMPAVAGERMLAILDFFRSQADLLITNLGGVDAVITEANVLYDQYVAPIDVPWVPDIAEPMLIDTPAKQIMAALLRAVYARVHKA